MYQLDRKLLRNSYLHWPVAKGRTTLGRFFQGLLFMISAILGTELLSRYSFQSFNLSGILILVVVYTLFSCGITACFINSVLGVLYYFYSFSIPKGIFHYYKLDLLRAISNGMTLVFTLALAIFLYQQFVACYHKMESIQRKYTKLLSHIKDGVVLYTLDEHYLPHRFIEVNPSVLKMVNLTQEEFLNTPPLELYSFLNGEDFRNLLTPPAMDNIVVKHVNFETRQGEEVPLELTFQGLEFGGEYIVMVIAKDLRKHQLLQSMTQAIQEKDSQLEILSHQDRLKTEFFSNISHELRTPIHVIFSTLQLLRKMLEEVIPQERHQGINKYFHIMRQNAYRLLRLVNNVIDISKIDSGFYEIELKNHNIVSLVENITLSVAEYVENKSITLIFDTEVEEQIIACDPDKIERIILNLLSNAVKFTPKGGEIMVKLKLEEGYLTISVSDTGVGIPESKIGNLFQRYMQFNNGLTKNYPGSGIGLSLVKSLVELHRGTIEVESTPDKGSTFTVRLPNYQLENCDGHGNPQEIQEESVYIEKINVEFSDIYS